MEYQLQLKPFERQDGFKYKVIQITNIALHSSDRQPTKSIGKKIKQAFAHNKPSRLYGLKIKQSASKPNSFETMVDLIQKDPEFIKLIQKEEKDGFKILLELPKAGIPVVLGTDTEEFINSKNGRRVIRGINKKRKFNI